MRAEFFTLGNISYLRDQRSYSTVDVRLGWHVGEYLDFSVVGQNLLGPLKQSLEEIPARWWESGEPSTEKIAWRR
jgi:hypothetical protein